MSSDIIQSHVYVRIIKYAPDLWFCLNYLCALCTMGRQADLTSYFNEILGAVNDVMI